MTSGPMPRSGPRLARNAAVLQRFKRELILARKITHKNVIRIFDLGVTGGAKFITMDYQHVEGTSFAAPITASVAAQMLEVDPTLTPALLREGLRSTARPVEDLLAGAQGAGVLRPLAAVQWARERSR